jgi:hypothetical protein
MGRQSRGLLTRAPDCSIRIEETNHGTVPSLFVSRRQPYRQAGGRIQEASDKEVVVCQEAGAREDDRKDVTRREDC